MSPWIPKLELIRGLGLNVRKPWHPRPKLKLVPSDDPEPGQEDDQEKKAS